MSDMHVRRHLLGAAVAAVGLAPALSGCGEQEAAGAELALSPAIDVAGVEMAFEPDQIAVEAGTIPVTFRNEGAIYHDFRIEDHWEVIFEAGPGASDSGEVNLEPGTYTFFCSIPGHREGGMEGTLYVREPES